jgi:hypothetical protein
MVTVRQHRHQLACVRDRSIPRFSRSAAATLCSSVTRSAAYSHVTEDQTFRVCPAQRLNGLTAA